MVAFFALLILVSVLFFPPPPVTVNGQLQVYLTENKVQKVYNDGDFDQNFDYSFFQADANGFGDPYFIQEPNEGDFSKGATTISDYEFSTLGEVYEFTSQLNTPNCVNQYIRWLLAQNYTETVVKMYNTPERQAAALRRGSSLTYLGDMKSYDRNYGIRYYVSRGSYYGGDTGRPGTLWEGDKSIWDGVLVEKYDSQDMIWRLLIDGAWVYNSERYPSLEPVYKVRLIRFPADNALTSAWTKMG